MQYERAFSYQFEDPQWPTKLGLGALISLVPILNLAVTGYTVGIVRNVAAHAPGPLPHWDDLGQKFMDGLLLTIAGLIYSLPLFIAIGVPTGLLLASGAASARGNLQSVSSILGAAGWVLLAFVVIFFILYSLFLSIIRPVILVIFSRDGTLASCFKLREIARIISHHSRPFLTTWVAVLLAGLAVGLIVGLFNLTIGWIPCIGWLAGLLLALGTMVYLLTVDAHLFGQFRLAALEGQPSALPLRPAKSQQNPGDLSS